MVDLMGQVVCGIYPSANAAYQKQRERFTVSRTAVYDKLNGVEPQVSQGQRVLCESVAR